ncbi:MAG TPA: peptidase S1 [Verrucomicrobia subdivision 3 bacterium]|nr:peptidase S1 [Limisphaerales bacterium]
MKLMSRSFFGLFTAVLGAVAVLAVSHFTSWGRDSQPAFNVSATPINRDARLGTSFAPIVKKVAPSVVNIFTTRFIKERPMRNPLLNDPVFRQFFGDQAPSDNRERTRKEQSLGSGVIVSADGYILTANHVVDGADEIKVSIGDNKKEFTARVIGKDQATDVAVLKIEANNLPAVTLADSDQLEIGDLVLAIGNPFGVGQSVTMGIVSGLGRSGLPGFNQYQDFIQTDAAINPGNSGGALVDAEGRLVGINTAIVPNENGGNQGIGFAVPINMARNVLERLVSGGKIERGYLGIAPQDIDAGLAKQFNLPDQNGALVGDVIPDAPAAKAGLKSGDVILSVNGKPIADAHSLQLTVSQCAPGSAATIKFIRNGVNKTLVITLDALPGVSSGSNDQNNPETGSSKAHALDGVTVADLDPQIRSLLRVPASVQGAIVTDVDSESNSADAGLQRNDLIIEINRQPVTGSDDAVRLCKAAKDDQILVKVWRRLGGFAGTRYLSVDNTKRPK